MDYSEALNKLFSLHQFGVKLGLESIRNFLEHIGNPHKKLKVIHVAGSNGKGSTSSFISSILQESKYKVGLYTSPHFVKFNERIRINGNSIDDKTIVDFMNENLAYINSNPITFFELTTAMAFQFFAENNIDYAVVETGLGGRLDATNVITSIASVITSISYEHTNILGNNLTSIANEKAGIIKPNQNVFIGILPSEASEVILKKCNEEGAKLIKLKENYDKKESALLLERKIVFDNIPLKGEYQKQNAALAVLVVKNIFPFMITDYIYYGLQNVIKNTGIQGRYEVYSTYPNIIFDSAHNIEGLSVFLEEYKNEKQKYKKKIILFGAMKDKNIKDILRILNESFDEIYATDIEYERAFPKNEIVKIGDSLKIKINAIDNAAKFITDFKNKKSEESLVVLGSMYVLGEIKKELVLLSS